MKGFVTLTVTLGGLLLAGGAHAVVIDFDGLATDTLVTSQFPGATFSSEAGREVRTFAFGGGTSSPNIICTAVVGGEPTCADRIDVVFSDPVNGLSYWVTGDDEAMAVDVVDVFDAGGLVDTIVTPLDASPLTPHLVDLTAFSSVTSISIHATPDLGGLGYDDFAFSVPEPGLLGLIGAGLALLPALAVERR
jgi:hypothetical protein